MKSHLVIYIYRKIIVTFTIFVFLAETPCINGLSFATETKKATLRPMATVDSDQISNMLKYIMEGVSAEDASKRTIYRPDTVMKVVRDFIELRELIQDPAVKRLVAIKPSLIYNIARQIELGTILEDAISPYLIVKTIFEALDILDMARKPDEAEREILTEALEIVRSHCVRHGLPFVNFSNDVWFYTPSPESKVIIASYKPFVKMILIPDNLSRDKMRRQIVHEAFHYISGGFPINLFNEGVTQYHEVMAWMEYYVIELEEEEPMPGTITSLLYEYAKYGRASLFLFSELVGTDEEFEGCYFPEVFLVEYILNYILPSREINPQEFLQAHMKGDMPFLIKLFGEETIVGFESLEHDVEKELDKPEGAQLENILPFLEAGMTLLKELPEPISTRPSTQQIKIPGLQTLQAISTAA